MESVSIRSLLLLAVGAAGVALQLALWFVSSSQLKTASRDFARSQARASAAQPVRALTAEMDGLWGEWLRTEARLLAELVADPPSAARPDANVSAAWPLLGAACGSHCTEFLSAVFETSGNASRGAASMRLRAANGTFLVTLANGVDSDRTLLLSRCVHATVRPNECHWDCESSTSGSSSDAGAASGRGLPWDPGPFASDMWAVQPAMNGSFSLWVIGSVPRSGSATGVLGLEYSLDAVTRLTNLTAPVPALRAFLVGTYGSMPTVLTDSEMAGSSLQDPYLTVYRAITDTSTALTGSDAMEGDLLVYGERVGPRESPLGLAVFFVFSQSDLHGPFYQQVWYCLTAASLYSVLSPRSLFAPSFANQVARGCRPIHRPRSQEFGESIPADGGKRRSEVAPKNSALPAAGGVHPA